MVRSFLRLIRAEEWIQVAGFMLAGYFLARNISWSHLAALLIALAAFVLITAYGFVINDFFDREFDKEKQNNRNPISRGEVSARAALILALSLLGLGLCLACLLPSLVGTVLFFVTAAVMTAYSAPPFRLKERFVWDVGVHALPFPIDFLIGYTLFTKIDPAAGLLALELLFFGLITGTLQEIRDHDADAASGFRTSVIRLGVKNSILVIRSLSVAFLLLFALTILAYFPPSFVLLGISLLPLAHFTFLSEQKIKTGSLAAVYVKCFVLFVPLMVASAVLAHRG